ncbi:hypothetical protein [Entomohabitans teleogrylli]|uniref:hypothetical protein n=1 Tax=Entomohabitans teleogrylli TaxID=1384589 RepID=UPI00073D9E80|nr:hypothetical protein [Entomohabitans teleogrylli]
MFRNTNNHSVKTTLSALLFLLFSCGAMATGDNSLPQRPQLFPSTDKAPTVIFQQAVNDDLAGYHREARQKYDLLNSTVMASAAALPSAVNLAALGRYGDARQAFSVLQQHGNGRERDYARLWDLWLTARTWQGGAAALQKTLTDKTANYKWFSAYESAIADIYAGKGSAKEMFRLIDGITFGQAEEKADAVTQAVFFVGGYYQYVINQPQKARELYEHYAMRLNNHSLERSLILTERQSLRASE